MKDLFPKSDYKSLLAFIAIGMLYTGYNDGKEDRHYEKKSDKIILSLDKQD